MILQKASKEEFDTVLFNVHKDIFDDAVEESFFRYDYALFTVHNNEPVSYVLINERSADTAEMYYGGTLKEHRGILSKESLSIFLEELFKKHQYVVFQTRNTNFPMLRLGLSMGAKITGVLQNPKGLIYVLFQFEKGGK